MYIFFLYWIYFSLKKAPKWTSQVRHLLCFQHYRQWMAPPRGEVHSVNTFRQQFQCKTTVRPQQSDLEEAEMFLLTWSPGKPGFPLGPRSPLGPGLPCRDQTGWFRTAPPHTPNLTQSRHTHQHWVCCVYARGLATWMCHESQGESFSGCYGQSWSRTSGSWRLVFSFTNEAKEMFPNCSAETLN